MADPGQLKQAFLNVILNAVDAMKGRGGILTISVITNVGGNAAVVKQSDRPDQIASSPPKSMADPRNDTLTISISDTGCGIAKDKIPHLFDPFYTDKEGGTGLGLAITHSLVEKNGGRISVESEVGIGTTFTLRFPTAQVALVG